MSRFLPDFQWATTIIIIHCHIHSYITKVKRVNDKLHMYCLGGAHVLLGCSTCTAWVEHMYCLGEAHVLLGWSILLPLLIDVDRRHIILWLSMFH